MVVQHNLAAMNANRMLGVTTGQQAKSSEKLSSGYRINRAADDAAGLSISEKMRKQINGLDRASTNAEDGVSAVQTAEGALTEVHSMLQRMNELAVQAANGTNSDDDRAAIQAEIDQLTTEIDRIAETTKFNEAYLLKGTEGEDKAVHFYDAQYYIANADIYAEGSTAAIADTDELSDVIASGKKIYTVAFDPADPTAQAEADEAVKGEDYAFVTKLYNASGDALSAEDAFIYTGDVFADAKAQIQIAKDTVPVIKEYTVNADLAFNLHVGTDAESTNKIGVTIEHMSAAGIGVEGLKVDTEDNATKAIETIAQAIQKVSAQRSSLGAIQNRLEHTIANLDNVVENTTAAESRIRDTDMAEEMVEYSKNNILMQAGQSVLAQANQSTQGVLSLLQ